MIWGLFGRLVFVYHSTWMVKIAAHDSGYKTYRTNDLSTNTWFVALVTFGEGWHMMDRLALGNERQAAA